MTSQAGSRPLHARLAPAGTPHQRGSAPGPNGGSTGGSNGGSTGASNGGSTGASNGGSTGRSGSGPSTDASQATSRDAGRAAAGGRSGEDLHAATMPHSHVEQGHTLIQDDPLAALLAEAQAAVSDGANALRDVRERYRAAYLEQVERWESLRARAESGEAVVGREVGVERSVLGRIDLAAKSLENAWLFLAREDTSLVSDPSGPPSAADAQMRIVEAQEQERTRLAREVHDGPAQALSNAIFQVELVQRLLDRDERLARAELKQLREVLTRELRGVRAYLSQLRPPLLADLGLSGAIHEAADQISTALNVPVHVDLADGVDSLPETVEVVALRVIQEALQNARKHAQPHTIRVRMVMDGSAWMVEVRDDGKGFEADQPPVSGRGHFGLQFMRERAELIGARFEVRSSPNLGTAVRMTIPPGAMGMPIPGEEN